MADDSISSFEWAFNAYDEGAVFTAFDIETTGLDPKPDKIVEIGAVKFDKRGLIARYSTLINPGVSMPAEASKVNNITDAMLAGQPSILSILPDFLFFVKNTVITAHNAPFDCGFLTEALKEHSFQPLPNPVADTLALARELLPGLKSHSLQKLASEFGIVSKDAHRALDDARLCMEIFLELLEIYSIVTQSKKKT